ncbi:BRO-N domain-containing protein, partial [Melissococcus plutonius]
MNTPQIFNFEQNEVRTILVNDEPFFVGKDVAKILGYSNTAKAIRDHVDIEDKLTERIVLSGQKREVNVINESGLYSLILSSKMPNAKKFKRWVTSEVLPSIRKNGMYMTDEKAYDVVTNP